MFVFVGITVGMYTSIVGVTSSIVGACPAVVFTAAMDTDSNIAISMKNRLPNFLPKKH